MVFEIAEPPGNTKSLVEALAALQDEIEEHLGGLPVEEFFEPQGNAWSPAGHLRHLIKSIRPIARAMGMPKLLLGILFGRSVSGSRSFEQVRDLYLAEIQKGLQAGRFAPSNQPEIGTEEVRAGLLVQWRSSGESLLHAMGRWPDRRLDSYRLPHPGMGKLTIREMLYFTLYHNAHHARRVHERAGKHSP